MSALSELYNALKDQKRVSVLDFGIENSKVRIKFILEDKDSKIPCQVNTVYYGQPYPDKFVYVLNNEFFFNSIEEFIQHIN